MVEFVQNEVFEQEDQKELIEQFKIQLLQIFSRNNEQEKYGIETQQTTLPVNELLQFEQQEQEEKLDQSEHLRQEEEEKEEKLIQNESSQQDEQQEENKNQQYDVQQQQNYNENLQQNESQQNKSQQNESQQNDSVEQEEEKREQNEDDQQQEQNEDNQQQEQNEDAQQQEHNGDDQQQQQQNEELQNEDQKFLKEILINNEKEQEFQNQFQNIDQYSEYLEVEQDPKELLESEIQIQKTTNSLYTSEIIFPQQQSQQQQSQDNQSQTKLKLSQQEFERQLRIEQAKQQKALLEEKFQKLNKQITRRKQIVPQQQQPIKKVHLLKKQMQIFNNYEKQAEAQNLVRRMNQMRKEKQQRQLRVQNQMDNYIFNRLPMLEVLQSQIQQNYDERKKIPEQLKELREKQEEIFSQKNQINEVISSSKGAKLKNYNRGQQQQQQQQLAQLQSIDESVNKNRMLQSERNNQDDDEAEDQQQLYNSQKQLTLPQIQQTSKNQQKSLQDLQRSALISKATEDFQQKQQEIQKEIIRYQKESQMKQKFQREKFQISLEKQQKQKMIQDLDKSFKLKLQKEMYYQTPEVQESFQNSQIHNHKHSHYISNLQHNQNPDFSAQLNSFQDQSSFANSELMKSQMRALGRVDYNWPRDIIEEDELSSQKKQLLIQELNAVKQRHAEAKNFSESLRAKEKHKQQRLIMRIENNKQKMLEEQLLREKHGTQFSEIEDPKQWNNFQEQLEQISNIDNQEEQEEEERNLIEDQEQNKKKQGQQSMEPELQLETEEKQGLGHKTKKKSGKKVEKNQKQKNNNTQKKAQSKSKPHKNSDHIENILQEFDKDESKP